MADHTRGLLDELLAERFGPTTSPTPYLWGGTVDLMREIEQSERVNLAPVIPLRTRASEPAVTQQPPAALTRRQAASQ